MQELEHYLITYSLQLLALCSVILIVFAVISLRAKHLTERWKEILFFIIVGATIIPTLFMGMTTVYLNVISSSGGPVHWHADFEVWACGNELELRDPKGLSNKIGTATFHEHNDKRIHLEGLVMEEQDASLGNFFHVIGGSLSATSFTLPLNDEKTVTYRNGDTCADGSTGEVQVFVFQTQEDGTYTQQKLSDPASFVMAPEQSVPTGDCIIVEFGESKTRTEKLCRSYRVAKEIDTLKGEKSDGN